MNQQNQVKQFHKAFNHPVADTPALMGNGRAAFRAALMIEEVNEFLEASTVADQADALVDLMYFALGTAVELGVELAPVFEIVHEANMAKLGEDGRPIYREDGKVLKPQGWQHPDIKGEIERQGGEGSQ